MWHQILSTPPSKSIQNMITSRPLHVPPIPGPVHPCHLLGPSQWPPQWSSCFYLPPVCATRVGKNRPSQDMSLWHFRTLGRGKWQIITLFFNNKVSRNRMVLDFSWTILPTRRQGNNPFKIPKDCFLSLNSVASQTISQGREEVEHIFWWASSQKLTCWEIFLKKLQDVPHQNKSITKKKEELRSETRETRHRREVRGIPRVMKISVCQLGIKVRD